jgi:excisionase family DNA binding protein
MEISNVELHNAITCRITLNCSELFLCGMGLGLNFIRQGGGNEAGWERLSVAHGLDQPNTAVVGSEPPCPARQRTKMSTQPSRIARPQSSHVIREAPIKSASDPAQKSHVSYSNDQVGAVTLPNLARPDETVVDSNVHLDSLLDSEEAGRFLRIHPVTVKRLARSGRLPGFRIGNRWRFRFSDLDDWAHSTVLSQHSLRRE